MHSYVIVDIRELYVYILYVIIAIFLNILKIKITEKKVVGNIDFLRIKK